MSILYRYILTVLVLFPVLYSYHNGKVQIHPSLTQQTLSRHDYHPLLGHLNLQREEIS